MNFVNKSSVNIIQGLVLCLFGLSLARARRVSVWFVWLVVCVFGLSSYWLVVCLFGLSASLS